MIRRFGRGPIAWMANNVVAANLLMLFLLIGGVLVGLQVKQEVFPEFTLDYVQVNVSYPGASPEEVERGIILAIEEEVRSVDGVKRVTSTATEGSASVMIELLTGTDRNRGLQDVKSSVDRITSFPQDAERPVVSLISLRRAVIGLVLSGDLSERVLYDFAESVRDELLNLPDITYVEVTGTRPPEISIEIPHEKLRGYDLTLEDIAQQVAASAIELPGGGLKTAAGEILLRTDERRDYGREFADIPIVTNKDGSRLLLRDFGKIIDGFRDIDRAAFFNGQPAVQLVVYRIGDQTPISVAASVHGYVDELKQRLPEGVSIHTWDDRSEVYRDRVYLLLSNAALGLVLVLAILGLFLEPRLAFWVTMGIPVSFLGAFLLMPAMDVSINMISLFAFIIALGIVVDDAIVVGENIFEHRQEGAPYLEAAVKGAQRVWVPVTFAILTNIAAFVPMFFIPGVSGRFYQVIPAIVVAVFLVSWIESLFVLPAHLGHQRPHQVRTKIGRRVVGLQKRFGDALGKFVQNYYLPISDGCIRNRYITLAVAIVLLLISIGFVVGGHVDFTFMPKVDADVISAQVELPFGVPVSETEQVVEQLFTEADQLFQELGPEASRGILSKIGTSSSRRGGGGEASIGSHVGSVEVALVPSDDREFSASQFANMWRDRTSKIRGLETLVFDYSTGPSSGASLEVELSHPDIDTLESAAAELAFELQQFSGVKDIDDGFTVGKPQLNFKVKPQARSLGVSSSELARQVRAAFYGVRALRQQRQRDEIWVMVRLPESERQREFNLENLLIRTKSGGEIPLREAAEIERGQSYTAIRRADGRRVVNVTADVVEKIANAEKVLADVELNILPRLLADYPGLQYSFEGQQRDQRESIQNLLLGFGLAMVVIFSMLAIPFRSYIQPAVVMTAVPFGFIGAIGGHLIMGYDLSLVSVMGIVALAGVVVNDSLVLVYHANELRAAGMTCHDAALQAGARRFRPILLTSLTTFLGLAPMIFETSMQARFLIPMAISLGCGVMFATAITLLLVPSLYLIVDEVGDFLVAAATMLRKEIFPDLEQPKK